MTELNYLDDQLFYASIGEKIKAAINGFSSVLFS